MDSRQHDRPVHVAAAVIRRHGLYLLTRRAEGGDLAGYWEFPGGKLEPPETAESALVRELDEELGVVVRPASRLTEITHDYPGRTVRLTFLEAEIVSGEPRALDVAAFGWFAPREMLALPILPADRPVVELLEETESGTAPAGAGDDGAARRELEDDDA